MGHRIFADNVRRHHVPPSQPRPADFNNVLAQASRGQPITIDPATGRVEYTVQPGDTVDAIASRTGLLPAHVLASLPGLEDPRDLQAGRKIVLFDQTRSQAALAQLEALETVHSGNGNSGSTGLAVKQEAHDQLTSLVEGELRDVRERSPTDPTALDAAMRDIEARAPGDERLRSAVATARRRLDTEFLGDPANLTTARNAALAAQQSGQWTTVTDAVLPQLRDLADSAKSPAEAEMAVVTRATLLTRYGSEDPLYAEAIDDAVERTLADDPAAEVAAAYERDGAPAAAAKLRELTAGAAPEDAASPAVADLILAKSQPTIGRIIAALGDDFLEPVQPGQTTMPAVGSEDHARFVEEARKDRDFDDPRTASVVLGDLSAATEAAALAPPPADGPDERGFTQTVSALARALPDFGPDDVRRDRYIAAIQWGVAKGNGANLALGLAKAWQGDAHGRGKDADLVVRNVAFGLTELRRQSVSDVEAFVDATKMSRTLARDFEDLLGSGYGPAVERFHADHPDIDPHAEETYQAVIRDGDALLRTSAAIAAYEGDLGGLPAFKVLRDARDDTTDKEKLAVVLDASPMTLLQLAPADVWTAASDAVPPGAPAAVTPWWMIRSNQDLIEDIIRSRSQPIAGVLSDWRRTQGAQPRTPPTTMSPGGQANRLAGASLAGIHVWSLLQNPDFFSKVYATLFSVGGGMKFTEFVGGLVQTGVVRPLGLEGGVVDKSTDFVTRTGSVWDTVGRIYAAAFIPVDGVYTLYNLAEGDLVRAGVFGLTTASDVMTFRAMITGGSTLWGVAALAVAATVNWVYGTFIEPYENEGEYRDFLIASGIKPEIAEALSSFDSEGNSIFPFLTALARKMNVEPSAMLDYVSKLPLDQVKEFVSAAHAVTRERRDDGTYPEQAKNDADINPPTGMPSYAQPTNYPGRTTPQSLNGFRIWAEWKGYDLPSG